MHACGGVAGDEPTGPPQTTWEDVGCCLQIKLGCIFSGKLLDELRGAAHKRPQNNDCSRASSRRRRRWPNAETKPLPAPYKQASTARATLQDTHQHRACCMLACARCRLPLPRQTPLRYAQKPMFSPQSGAQHNGCWNEGSTGVEPAKNVTALLRASGCCGCCYCCWLSRGCFHLRCRADDGDPTSLLLLLLQEGTKEASSPALEGALFRPPVRRTVGCLRP